MREVVVTVPLTPSEFDVVRRALTAHEANQDSIARDSSTDPKLRSEARAEQARVQLVAQKLSN